MTRIAKLFAATALGLSFAQAYAAPVFEFSEDAYNTQFTPEALARAQAAAPTLPKHIDHKAKFAFSEDAYNAPIEQTGNQVERIVVKAKLAGGNANGKVASAAKASDEPWYSTNP